MGRSLLPAFGLAYSQTMVGVMVVIVTSFKTAYARTVVFSAPYSIATNQGPCSQNYGFSSSHVWIWDLDHKENCSVQLVSCVWLFVTPWTAACQASLSITNSQSLVKLMSIKSVRPFITKKAARWRIVMLLNCGVGEDSWESLGLQGNPTSQS